MVNIRVTDLSTHTDVGSNLDGLLEVFREERRQVGGWDVGSEAAHFDNLSVSHVVGDDLGHLWEVPSVPFLDSHGVDVELLVEVVEQRNGLDDHDVDLVWAETELEARERVRETKRHGVNVLLFNAVEKIWKLRTQTTEKVDSGGIAYHVDIQLLSNGGCKLWIHDRQRLRFLV